MNNIDYFDDIDISITVSDSSGKILYMNHRSTENFKKDGGLELVGKSLLDCHPEPSRSKLVDLLESPRTNAYTIEKNGVKKLIYQTPWYDNNKYCGLIEFSIELPENLPNFVRG